MQNEFVWTIWCLNIWLQINSPLWVAQLIHPWATCPRFLSMDSKFKCPQKYMEAYSLKMACMWSDFPQKLGHKRHPQLCHHHHIRSFWFAKLFQAFLTHSHWKLRSDKCDFSNLLSMKQPMSRSCLCRPRKVNFIFIIQIWCRSPRFLSHSLVASEGVAWFTLSK